MDKIYLVHPIDTFNSWRELTVWYARLFTDC